MTEYLSYQFTDNQDVVDTFDELPLWSAAFGLLLLKHVRLQPDLKVLDLGSGTGFPLIELAERLGKSCKLYGLDPWKNANDRARHKIKSYGLTHVEVLDGSADNIPFDNDSIDLIVSNLGVNNFDNAPVVFQECRRVLKPRGKLALTTNLDGHWKTFYQIFEDTLRQLGKATEADQLLEQQAHRGNIESVSRLFSANGFKITRYYQDTLDMNFLDGSALLNHHFVKLGWLSSWRDFLPDEDRIPVFTALEENLNAYSKKSGGLQLTVPMLFMEGEKES
jgi:ubiquinone/menaquinone biosynthesis C-methylase UbiE